MQTAFHKPADLRAKPIQVKMEHLIIILSDIFFPQTFCNIPKLGKNEHTKTFKIIGNNESQFLLDEKVCSRSMEMMMMMEWFDL